MRAFGLVGMLVVLFTATMSPLQGCSQPAAKELTAQEIAAKSAEAMQNVKSFHFDLETEGGVMAFGQGITVSKAQGEVVAPDRIRLQFTGGFAGMQVELGLVSVGDKQYLQNPLNKKWQPMKASLDPSALFRPDGGVPSLITKAQDLERTGTETVDGAEVYHLKGTLTSQDLASLGADPNSNAKVDTEAWVGTQDFRLRQVTLRGPIGAGEAADLLRTIRLSRFDETFDIQPPA